MNRKALLVTLSLFLSVAAATAGFAENLTAHADLINTEGKKVGEARLKETPTGVIIKADMKNLPEGWHAFHLHTTGKCDLPDFTSAGGHYNPNGHDHGYLVKTGPHAGDLPNIYVGKNGRASFTFRAKEVTLGQGNNTLFDQDGTALMVHAKADDYKSQPAGDAGGRIVCGVVRKK